MCLHVCTIWQCVVGGLNLVYSNFAAASLQCLGGHQLAVSVWRPCCPNLHRSYQDDARTNMLLTYAYIAVVAGSRA